MIKKKSQLSNNIIMTSKEATKRAADICLSTVGLFVSCPALTLIAISVKGKSKGPILFIQERVGKHGKTFRMYKFRTMMCGAEAVTLGRYICSEDSAITPVGKILRRWALDELPQLFNVLKGEMSIVGPRPTLSYQVEKYTPHQRKRLNVKPGITGWAQVNGRNKLSWPERIELDVWYAENWSVGLDVKIMLMTIPALLKKEFAFAKESAEEDEIVRFDGEGV